MLKLAAPIIAALVLLNACDTKVQQQQPPRIPDAEDDGLASGDGADIAETPDAGSGVVEKKEVTAEERRRRCCQQCVTGLEKDKTGDAPDKIPCEDFTVHVKSVCLKWFHDNPMKASEAGACLAELDAKAGGGADKPSPFADTGAKPADPKGK
ncbi:MAG: hypothetical protein DRI90_01735 [Deltaproteobacteria bacterium]|nr:MAG: hypothetical protein DRI90_01735 [Deltaproteobacteria bacterium]